MRARPSLSAQQSDGPGEILRDDVAQLRPALLVGSPQQCRRVISRHEVGVAELHIKTARRGDSHSLMGQCRQGCRAQRNDDFGPHCRDFGLEPGGACCNVTLRRRLVNAALAAGLPGEVLDRVGEVELVWLEARLRQQRPEEPAGRTNEGFALLIFFVPRLFADEHQARTRTTRAGNALGSVLP